MKTAPAETQQRRREYAASKHGPHGARRRHLRGRPVQALSVVSSLTVSRAAAVALESPPPRKPRTPLRTPEGVRFERLADFVEVRRFLGGDEGFLELYRLAENVDQMETALACLNDPKALESFECRDDVRKAFINELKRIFSGRIPFRGALYRACLAKRKEVRAVLAVLSPQSTKGSLQALEQRHKP